jgi:archaellum component FlaF (FlaF/FlaG flagellin family)
MSTVQGGPGNIVTNGLVLNLDAANPRSYLPPYNGTTWFNLASSSNNGTLINNPTYNSANGGSIVFDGVDDYVTLGNNIPLRNVSQFSYSSFVKFNTSAGASGNTFFSYSSYTVYTNDILFAWNKSNSKLFFQINNGSDGGGSYSYSPNNTWINISVIYDGSLSTNSDKLKVYINGINVSLSFDYTVPSTTADITHTCLIGSYGGFPPTWYFTGNIANTLLYNRALSASEINQNFQATRARFGI